MDHPGGEPCAPPNPGRRLIPCFVYCFDSHGVCIFHYLNGAVDQTCSDSLPPETFIHVYGINDSNSTRIDDGRNRLPIVNTPDEKTRHHIFLAGNKSDILWLLESLGQPMFHGCCGI